MKLRESLVLQALLDVVRPKAVIDRTTASAAKSEGFDAKSGVILGEETTELAFLERRLRYAIPVEIGQKTGFYFDQRPLRARIETLSKGKRVLDAYCFVGPFALAAARGGATEIIACDESALALEVAASCARLNGVDGRIDVYKRQLGTSSRTGPTRRTRGDESCDTAHRCDRHARARPSCTNRSG